MIVVTGGAGFIGSALAQKLNDDGHRDLLIVDDVDHPEKQKNLDALQYHELQSKDAFLENVHKANLPDLQAILHMGACSSTTETDEVFLTKNNFEYTRDLARYCLEKGTRFIYASSAATYGNGEQGYDDDESKLEILKPLNLYGESKQNLDVWASQQGAFDQIVGLKYFNVYGPNEYHKGDMQSLARKGFFQVRDHGKIRLFKSYKTQYADGGQERDFLYVKDAVAMTLFFLDRLEIGGLYNVGSGTARNWNDLANAIFFALDREPNIEYIDMPESIRNQYQYHTQAKMDKIRQAGYSPPTTTLEAGITDYVQNYLIPGKRLGE
jgi:ADP-L-glycero-D-manno-heptose 6-epimerase